MAERNIYEYTTNQKQYRECGSCSLCCKVLQIDALNKPANVWCGNCIPGQGCTIYKERPQACVNFTCLWQAFPDKVPEELHPAKCKFLICYTSSTKVLDVVNAPDRPDAWLRYEKYIRGLANDVTVRILAGRNSFYLSGNSQWKS